MPVAGQMGWSPLGLKIHFRKERWREGRRKREGERGGDGSGLNLELLEGPKLSTVRVRMRVLCVLPNGW